MSPQSGEGGGGSAGTHTGSAAPAAALPGGGRWEGDCNFNFFRTIRISVGNFCRRRRGAGEACGVVGRTPSPLGPRLAQCPVHLGDTTPGRCRGPAGAALLAMGGLPPTPPPQAVASAMRWVWLCTEHIAAPDRCSGSTAPAPSWPAARGPAGPGCPAPPRAGAIALLPRPTRRGLPGARERGSDAGTPHSSPSLLLAPRSAAWKCRCSARCVGKRE